MVACLRVAAGRPSCQGEDELIVGGVGAAARRLVPTPGLPEGGASRCAVTEDRRIPGRHRLRTRTCNLAWAHPFVLWSGQSR
jgi:hypothetical protein